MFAIESIFPTPVGCVRREKEFTEKELEIFDMYLSDPIKNGNHDCNNESTREIRVLDNEGLQELKNELTEYLNEFFQIVYKPTTDVKLYITHSWLNATKYGQIHPPHDHANSLISGVLYINSTDTDNITFIRSHPRQPLGSFHINSYGSQWSASEQNFKAIKNGFVMFPSCLAHEVRERQDTSQDARISLSFNTWFKGTIGDDQAVSTLSF